MSRAGRARATPSSKAAADSRPLKVLLPDSPQHVPPTLTASDVVPLQEQHEPPGPGAYPSPTSMGKQALSTKRSAPSTRFCGADRGWEHFNVSLVTPPLHDQTADTHPPQVFVSEQSAHKGRDTPGPGNYPLRRYCSHTQVLCKHAVSPTSRLDQHAQCQPGSIRPGASNTREVWSCEHRRTR